MPSQHLKTPASTRARSAWCRATARPAAIAEGVGIGSAVGGIGGLLAGLGAFGIPGIGPVVGAGWLATTVLGAAAGGVAGGLIGALTEAGVEERHAHVYAEHLRRGGALVTARVEDAEVDAAAAILGQSGSVDVEDAAPTTRPAAGRPLTRWHGRSMPATIPTASRISGRSSRLCRAEQPGGSAPQPAGALRRGRTSAKSVVGRRPRASTPTSNCRGTGFSLPWEWPCRLIAPLPIWFQVRNG